MNEISYQLCQVDFKFETSIQYKPSYSQQYILKSIHQITEFLSNQEKLFFQWIV